MTSFSNQNQLKYEIADPIEVQNYYQCAHCDTFFIPQKRFVQKYCSESCRVMACRDRKAGKKENHTAGLGGPRIKKQHTTTTKGQTPTSEHNNTSLLEELKTYLDERDVELLKKVVKIQENQTYHMWISALAPLLAEPVRKSLGRLLQGNKKPQDVNQFLQQVAPKIKELPQELQVMVMASAKEYWDASRGTKDLDQKKSTSALPGLKDVL